jgi:hypothetical protein
MSEVSQKTPGFVRDLGEAARQNPLSAALIGMGVLWLFTGGRTSGRVGELARRGGFDRIPDAVNDAFETTRSTFRSGADVMGERVGSERTHSEMAALRLSTTQPVWGGITPIPRPNM